MEKMYYAVLKYAVMEKMYYAVFADLLSKKGIKVSC